MPFPHAMILTVPSFAKINWTLKILGRRTDGYHELRTILQTVSLCDTLSLTRSEVGLELTCNAPGVPLDETNLIQRAARLFITETRKDFGVRIHLEKRIPVAAGLGGGSSNAAVTLLALERLFEVRLEPARRIEIAASLGADVPFFLLGGSGIGVGRGDEVHPLHDISFPYLLLVNPGVAVPTVAVYRALPAELTMPYVADMMPFSLEAASRSMSTPLRVLGILSNDLEPGVVARYPLLGEVRKRLIDSGSTAVLMSGSGATFFALFDSEAMRSVAQQDLSDTGWWCVPVRTIGRREYRSAIGIDAGAVQG
ncbi:MAG: 4-(cytidine 5'-diphospho)-2-C-methyl-D-erythritol kinase [Acidobacteriota bacterium]